jgi:hypothetical protein
MNLRHSLRGTWLGLALLVLARALAWGQYNPYAPVEIYDPPSFPISAQDPADCDRVRQLFQDQQSRISSQHQACLDSSAEKNHSVQNPDTECSKNSCQSWHTQMYNAKQDQKRVDVGYQACMSLVRDYQARVEAEQERAAREAEESRRQEEQRRAREQAEAQARKQQDDAERERQRKEEEHQESLQRQLETAEKLRQQEIEQFNQRTEERNQQLAQLNAEAQKEEEQLNQQVAQANSSIGKSLPGIATSNLQNLAANSGDPPEYDLSSVNDTPANDSGATSSSLPAAAADYVRQKVSTMFTDQVVASVREGLSEWVSDRFGETGTSVSFREGCVTWHKRDC